jgi:gamma-glutamyltranspeptidase/glutathione hydrolase
MVAATFTHGSTFGAQVTADGLGVTLGHGMSRFDPHSDHPNSPGPGKRPLHNMCPSVVLRHGQPVLAVGGAGGLRIPNSLYDVLINYLIGRDSMADSIAAPRILCTGTRTVGFEKKWPEAQVDYLRKIGFNTRTDVGAYVSAVSWNPKTGECAAAAR